MTDWQVLRDMLGMQVTEEQLESIADRTIQEADLDRDDAISFEEFRKVSAKILHLKKAPVVMSAEYDC